MKLQHTPGPWLFDEQPHHMRIEGGDGDIVCHMTGDSVASHIQDVKIKEANARLIAAAPEMLDWLIKYYIGNIRAFGCYDQKNLEHIIESATRMSIEEVVK